MILTLLLAGTLLGSPTCRIALGNQEEQPVEKSLLPGEPGYVLKRTRELVDLARCRDSEARAELILVHARERLREREAMMGALLAGERAQVARGLGQSYRQLALEGGPGALECGVAEGRDMEAAHKRYLDRIVVDQERWTKLVSSLPSSNRAIEEPVLEVGSEAPRRAEAARVAGLDFLKKERERRESTPPAAPEILPTPPRPEPEPSKREPSKAEPVKPEIPKAENSKPELPKPEVDRPRKEEGMETPRGPEHHPPHPHRPHH